MSSHILGESTSVLEVTHIDSRGFWLLLDGKEHYLSFAEFPWFANATVSQISHVIEERRNQLHWPDLDIDLTVEMIDNPGKYPLKYK